MFKKFFIFKNVDNQMRPRATLNLIIMTIIIIIIIIRRRRRRRRRRKKEEEDKPISI